MMKERNPNRPGKEKENVRRLSFRAAGGPNKAVERVRNSRRLRHRSPRDWICATSRRSGEIPTLRSGRPSRSDSCVEPATPRLNSRLAASASAFATPCRSTKSLSEAGREYRRLRGDCRVASLLAMTCRSTKSFYLMSISPLVRSRRFCSMASHFFMQEASLPLTREHSRYSEM